MDDMAGGETDEKSVIVYVAKLRQAFARVVTEGTTPVKTLVKTCDGNDGPPFWYSAAVLRFSAAILRHCGCCSQCWC